MKIKKLTKKQIIALIIVAVLLVVFIPTGIVSVIKDESPFELVSDVFSDNDKLVNKWQGVKGASAYEFKEDGTYDSYITTIKFSGEYETKGKKLILKNPSTHGSVVYEYKISKEDGIYTLTLKLIEENGKESGEKEEIEFKQVDHINTKSFVELFEGYNAETTTEDKD